MIVRRSLSRCETSAVSCAHLSAVVRHLRQHQRASTGDLLKVTGLSRPVLRNHLETLRREGVISWHGNAPRDPRAYWYLPG